MFRGRTVLFGLLVAAVSASRGAEAVFEDLGQPVPVKGLAVELVTQEAPDRHTAWGIATGAGNLALVGVRIPGGELVRADLLPYGRSHVQMTRMADGNLCIFTGVPGRFLRCDVGTGQLRELGKPIPGCTYWLGKTISRENKFYVGCYPAAKLVCCDLTSGEVHDLGRLPDDPKEKYVVHPATSDDNIVYCPVGLHHRELWAFDPRTRTKCQILPERLTKDQGAPAVWTGTDGQVYGRAGGSVFLCTPQGIELGKEKPVRRGSGARKVGDLLAGDVDPQGRLWLTDRRGKKKSSIATEFRATAHSIFCVGCAHEGKIYGGSISPAHTFCYDPSKGTHVDLGPLTTGQVQVYDIHSHAKGLFLASYPGAGLDFFDPRQAVTKGQNPRRIAMLSQTHQQERPLQLVPGPDENLYVPTIPVKGLLGGALVRVNPADFAVQVWRNLVPEQSIIGCAAVPETGELFCVSSVGGGSSAIPTQKEACALLWDVKAEKIAWQGQPLPGTRSYGGVARAQSGILYGIADDKYYAFDPRARKVVFTGKLPVRSVHFPGLSAQPVGPRGLLCGAGGDAIFAIDPADHRASILARHPSLAHAHGLCVLPDGTLYYGSSASLMRCKLVLQ